MLQGATLDSTVSLVADTSMAVPRIAASATSDIGSVDATWRRLAAAGVESPGQTVEFTRLWAETQGIAATDLLFVVGEVEGVPVALLPLMRMRRYALHVLTWIPGRHVGCNAPVVDAARLTAMTSAARAMLWSRMLSAIPGADLVYLPHVPQLAHLAELGRSIPADTLYRAEFSSWENANTTQRNKSRRKHDRQQGERLEALGAVSFAELGNRDELAPVIEVMFRQRAARFATMGVADPFASEAVRRFYLEAAGPDSAVEVRMHVLRLEGEIVAVRYNIVSEARMFCLISSMSDDPRIQGGSPGKQCLLRVMQTVFDAGITSFDMGAGFTDEKRHWCNVQIPVRQHYLPLSPLGRAAAAGHRGWQTARRKVKEDPRLLAVAKKVRAVVNRKSGPAAKDEAE